MRTFLLALCFLTALIFVPSAQAEIRSNLENPADGEPAAGISMISGWAFCIGSDMSYVEGFLNDSSVGLLPFGYSRMDVANANPGVVSAGSSGFGMQINWGNVPPGVYTLKLIFTCVSGEKASVQRNIKTMRYGDVAFVDSFDLANATVSLDKSTNPPQIVLENVRIHNSQTGEWKTITLRFQLSVGMQGLILTSASMVGGDPMKVSYVFDAEAPQDLIRQGIEAGIVVANQELAKLNAGLMPFTVYAAGNLDNLILMHCAVNSRCRPEDLRITWQNHSGMAYYGTVFFYTGGAKWASIPSDRSKKSHAVHEVYHEAQETMVGSPNISLGPPWLVEGSACFAEIGWSGTQAPKFTFEDYKAYLIKDRLAGQPCNLALLETRDGMAAMGSSVSYACGVLAASYLFETTPHLATLLLFWQAIGQGQSWQEAFVIIFGRSKDAFYTQFAAYRASLG